MQFHVITPETANSCNTCCCKSAEASPGESEKWVLNYAPLILPAHAISLLQSPEFEWEKITCESDPRDTVLPELVSSDANATYLGDLAPRVTGGTSYSFSAVPFAGPKKGSLAISEDGSYTYTPLPGFQGYDRFFWQVSVDGKPPVIQEAVIAIGAGVAPPTIAMLRPDLAIRNPVIDNKNFTLSFALDASPAAPNGSVWRLKVKQGYRDCNNCLYTIDCFDVTVGSCG